MCRAVEDSVEEILRNCGVRSPVVPTTRIIEKLGLPVRGVSDLDKNLLARTVITEREKERGIVIIEINETRTLEEQHFGVARELGRYVLSRSKKAGQTRIDNLLLPELDEQEKELTLFADCFIVPRSMKRYLYGLDTEEAGRIFLAPKAVVNRQTF